MGLLFTIKALSEHSGWGRSAQVSHSGELLLKGCSNVERKVPPSSSPALVVSDQQPLSGVTSHSLSSLRHPATSCLPWLGIPERRRRGFN